MSAETDSRDAAAIIDVVERLAKPEFFVGAAIPLDQPVVAVVPQGKQVVDLKPFADAARDTPRCITDRRELLSVDAVIDYAIRFKTVDSVLFWSDIPEKPRLDLIVDYHGQGAEAAPRFGNHRGQYAFPISEQAAAWLNVSGKALDQAAFATFLQDRQYDIQNPPLDWMQVPRDEIEAVLDVLNLRDDIGEIDDTAAAREPDVDDEDDRYIPRSALYKLRQIRFGSAARLIQLARTVEVAVNASAKAGFNPKTGERVVHFEEEHETRDQKGRKVTVPDAFFLSVPIFANDRPHLIPVRLQYRQSGGRFVWGVTLIEWRRMVQRAVLAAVERVGAETGVPTIHGIA